ncbi:MAG: hypothetical protein GY865_06880 [candidate division Zixibacteria bacterium]|nr:hypothetical protein [candidate division Zixibacteria bacterium]
MHKVDQKLNIIISPKYRQHVINMDEKETVFKYIFRCNNKKEFYQFYLGALPPSPRDLTLYRPKYDKKGGEYDTHPSHTSVICSALRSLPSVALSSEQTTNNYQNKFYPSR